MLKEAYTQAGAVGSALDQTRDISQDEVPFVHGQYAEVGYFGREGIGGYFWPGVGEPIQEGGFPGVGETNETDIGQNLDFHLQPPDIARLSRQGPSGGLIGGRLEMDVPPSAVSALKVQESAFVPTEIPDKFSRIRILDDGSRGHGDHHILPMPPVALGTFSVTAVLGVEFLLVPKMRQGPQVSPDLEDGVPSPSAVAAGGASHGGELLPAEGNATVSAVARGYFYYCFIGEFLHGS